MEELEKVGGGMRAILTVLGSLSVVLTCIVLLLWLVTRDISQEGARAWAIAATLLLPVTAFAAYRLGLTESRAHVRGVQEGFGQVAQAAGSVLSAGATAMDLRLQGLQRTREIVREQLPPPPPNNFLIMPPITHQGTVRYLDGGGEEE